MTTSSRRVKRSATAWTYRLDGWVVYFDEDRHVLWVDAASRDIARLSDLAGFRSREDGEIFPLAVVAPNPAMEAVFATHLPQAARITVKEDGEVKKLSVRAFPHFDIEGSFDGVLQVVEPCARQTPGGTEYRRKDIENPFDYALAGIILYDPLSDTVVGANRWVVQETGYPASEFERMPGKQIFLPEQVETLERIFHRMIKAGAGMLWGQTLTLRDCKGREREYFCSLRPLPEKREPGSPIIMCVSVDPKMATGRDGQSCKPSPGFVAEALEDGLWEYDFKARKFYYSPNFASVFGAEGATSDQGKTFDEYLEQVHPADADVIFHNWRQLLKSGVHYRTQYRIRSKTGEWRWILATIHAIINDADGHPERVLGMHMDFTDAVRTERNLLDAETKLRMIFENAGFGIAVTAMDGTMQKVNPAMALILRRESEELIGHRLPEYALPEDAEGMVVMLDRLIRGGRKQLNSERRFRTGDGRLIWGRLVITISENELDGDKCVIVFMEDITERLAKQERLQYNANHDALTGAWSRGALMERLGQHVNLALRYDHPLTFCICDLDHFKRVNDVHGHQTGDKVLVEFVKILIESVRDTDIVGRYGGEEFAIVFPNTPVEGAEAAMERAREVLREREFRSGNKDSFHATATFGLTEIRPRATTNSMIAEADSALYHGKKNGRNRVVIFGPEQQ